MRIILGVLAPDAGEVRWRGQPMNDEMRKQVGYLPEDHGQTFSDSAQAPSRALSGWCAGLSSVTKPARYGTVADRAGADPAPKQHLQLLEQLPQAQADATWLGRPSRSRVRNPWATDTKVT
jgi:hypothetical protein